MIEQIFIWLGNTAIGTYLAGSTAAFAATEALHIIALSLVGGAILVADLTVLGVVLKSSRAEGVLLQLQTLFCAGLGVVAVSGVLLVAAGPYKYYTNPLFPLKLGLLVLALICQGLLLRRLRAQAEPGRAAKVLAGTSLVLWTAVVITGRWLGLI
jgi:hypothetical protein